eukprot:Seg1649.4 transcript_id=Seg1649.4/GoldUCD/mRNA.D3Y31 product="Bile acid-CoA:amino acid N-acyltransferase" protein_id=Seg1649.4/GoldUCD/D3Y31
MKNGKKFSRFFCSMATRGKINVDKMEAMVDETINLRVEGLRPKQKVTLRATSRTGGRNNTIFQSYAHYEANSDGCINLAEDVSMGGTYKGIEPMGLFWSIVPLQNADITETRIFHKEISKPFESRIELYIGCLDFGMKTCIETEEFCKSFDATDAVSINRWYFDKKKVRKEIVKSGRLRGDLYIPNGTGNFKGVIDLFGSAGGLIPSRAALLASHGFAAYALPFFNYEDLPPDATKLDVEYFEEAADWLMQHPQVDGRGVGIVSTSLGLQMALLLATRRRKEIKAIVGINGTDSVLMSPIYIDGKASEFVPMQSENIEISKDGHFNCRFLFGREKDDFENARIPIENMDAKLLYLASEDDQNTNSDIIGLRMLERMDKYGRGDQIEVIIYPKAGHLLEPPHMPHCPNAFHKTYGYVMSWGGEPKHHARAQEDAWLQTLKFLQNNI